MNNTIIDAVRLELGKYFEPDLSRLESLYKGRKENNINVYMYVLNDFEFNMLEKDYYLNNECDLNDFVIEFDSMKKKIVEGKNNNIKDKINNFVKIVNLEKYMELIERRKDYYR